MSSVAPTNYSDLKEAVNKWAARSDLGGTTAEGLIALGESFLNRKLPELNAMEGERFALTDEAPTNWLLTNYPDVYLAAVLVWGNFFMKESPEAQQWTSVLSDGINDVQWIDARETSKETLDVDEALLPVNRYFNLITGE